MADCIFFTRSAKVFQIMQKTFLILAYMKLKLFNTTVPYDYGKIEIMC